ncbi:carbohydrate binding [Branchiostoma belcheri]|nr:carbohydrate binding [Branchiostoma belcheri]
MAHSGDNKARRPLPPLPHLGFSTGAEFPPSDEDDGDPDIHMYNYVDKAEINRQLSLQQTNSNDGQPSGEGTDRRQVTVGRNVVGLVHNQLYGAVASSQEDNKGKTTETTTEGHAYNYVDTDGISNLRQKLDDPAVTDCNIPGLIDNTIYQRWYKHLQIFDKLQDGDLPFLRFIIIAIAVLALLGAGAGIIMYLTGTLGGPAEINMPSVVTDRGNWTTAKPVTTTVTATYLPVTLTKTSFMSATKLHRATNGFSPSNETATTPIPTAQAKLPQVTTTLPQVTTTLPQVTTTLPPITTTLPHVTTTMPPVTTTPPQVTTTLPHVTTTLPPVTTTPPQVTTTLPQVTTTLLQVTALPAVTTTLPHVTTTLPPVTTTLPPVTSTLPHVTTTLPQVTPTLPHVTPTLPQVTATLPHVTTTLLQVTTKLPHVVTTLLQVTTTLPHVATTLPPVTTTLPPVTSTLPHVTTTLPHVTPTLPQVTATLPQVTATLPQVTAKPPKMTTTLQCLKLTPPANGWMDGSNSYGDEVYFRCVPGYNLVGDSPLTCQYDGTWSGTFPTCIEAAVCPHILLANGGAFGSSQTYLRFFCNEGYTLAGASLLKCQSNGTWSGNPPTCRVKKCTNGYQLLAQTCIKVYSYKKDYAEALAVCEKDGATLAMPKTRELDVALRNMITKVGMDSFYWIGLVKCDGTWKWADGSRLGKYKGWNPNEPNNPPEKSDCGQYWSGPTGTPMWDDTRCCYKMSFVCQATQSHFPQKSGTWQTMSAPVVVQRSHVTSKASLGQSTEEDQSDWSKALVRKFVLSAFPKGTRSLACQDSNPGPLDSESSTVQLRSTMSTTKNHPSQMAYSGDNKACRPLPSLPFQVFNTDSPVAVIYTSGRRDLAARKASSGFQESTPNNGDEDESEIHMYNYVDKAEINRELSLRQAVRDDGNPSGGSRNSVVTVGRTVVGLVHNQTGSLWSSLSWLRRVLFGAAGALPRPTQLGSPVACTTGLRVKLAQPRSTPDMQNSYTGVMLLPGGLLSWAGNNDKSPEDSLLRPR